VFAGLATSLPSVVFAQTEQARPVVEADETIMRVKGTGSVTAPPEVMTISIGVTTTAPTAAQALDENNRKLAPVLAKLREEGIVASDIRSSDLDVEPQFAEGRARGADRIIGFRAYNSVEVTTDALERAGDLVSLLFDVGANSINGPRFTVKDTTRERLVRDAESAALREGRAQAEATAKALGMRVGRLLLVSDSQVEFRDGSGYIVVTGSRVARTPIEPGEITIEADYDMEFTLIPE